MADSRPTVSHGSQSEGTPMIILHVGGNTNSILVYEMGINVAVPINCQLKN